MARHRLIGLPAIVAVLLVAPQVSAEDEEPVIFEADIGAMARIGEPPLVAYAAYVTTSLWFNEQFGVVIEPRYQVHVCSDSPQEPDHWLVRLGAGLLVPSSRATAATRARLKLLAGLVTGFATAISGRGSCVATETEKNPVHYDLGVFGSVAGEVQLHWLIFGIHMDVESRVRLSDTRDLAASESFSVGLGLSVGIVIAI